MKMFGRFIWGFFVFVIIVDCATAQTVPTTAQNAVTPNLGREISVTGEGWGSISPNVARISVNFEESGSTAKEAAEAVEKKVGAFNKSIESASGVTISSRDEKYLGAAPGTAISKSSVVRARRTVGVEVSDLAKVPTLIDLALAAGAGSVPDVEYLVREGGKAVSNVIAIATEDALAKAQAVAKSAKVELGAVNYVTVTEEPVAQVLREQRQIGANLADYAEREVHVLVTVGVAIN